MSQGFQKDVKRILQEFNPNLTIVSQDYFLRFPNSTFSMLLVEEEDEQEKEQEQEQEQEQQLLDAQESYLQVPKMFTQE